MYLKREIDSELELWMQTNNRKPLLLRGARQVGKSSAVRQLGTKFKYFIELNFDENPELVEIFKGSFNPVALIEKISVYTQIPIIEGETLLFLDEIQSCIPAISSLRYFYEKMSNLHVIATGSLIEFALSEVPSFGVGRVRSLFVYSFSFYEFLVANNEDMLLEVLKKAIPENEFPELFHKKTTAYFKKFLIIGGMPEAVKTYIQNGNMLEVQRVLDDLVVSIEADFTKYKNNISSNRIREVFEAIIQQMGNKFSYSYPNATMNNVQIKEILELLRLSGLIYFVTHSASNGIPLGAEINNKKRKILIFDTGIFQRILGLDIAKLLIENDFTTINKGNIAELYTGLELLKSESCYLKTDLNYWQREVKNSQAEVDYVIQKQELIIPIEVKSGTKGAMQSIYKFMEEKQSKFGIRTSLENFGILDQIKIIPLYAISNLRKMK